MPIVVVGGHSRNIGKTSVVAAILRSLPHLQWTAFKITQYGHGICSADGDACDCATDDHTIAISEERNPATGTDSARYLAAGAARSFWVRTRQGQLAEAMPRLRRLLAAAPGPVLIESNSILRFLQPDLSLTVLDPAIQDFKESARRYLDRVDAVVFSGSTHAIEWPGVSRALVARLRHFHVAPPTYWTPELGKFVADSLELLQAKRPRL